MTTALLATDCPIACSCPCPILEHTQTWTNTWGFTEPCPEDTLQPGTIISSPYGSFQYEILSYPFSRLYLDFKGLVGYARGHEVIDTQARMFWKCLFLMLASAVANREMLLPPWLMLGMTGRLSPHLDNNAWIGWPISQPQRDLSCNFLSYYRRLVGGSMVEVFTLRWTFKLLPFAVL